MNSPSFFMTDDTFGKDGYDFWAWASFLEDMALLPLTPFSRGSGAFASCPTSRGYGAFA